VWDLGLTAETVFPIRELSKRDLPAFGSPTIPTCKLLFAGADVDIGGKESLSSSSS